MPSSLTKVISRALVYSTRPPVSDYGTVIMETPYEVFLGSVIGPLRLVLPRLVSVSSLINRRIFLPVRAFHFSPGQPSPGRLALLRPSLGDNASTIVLEY